MNSASGHYHTIGGGMNNAISDDIKNKRSQTSTSTTVGGGCFNTAEGIGNSILGGLYNDANGMGYATVVGGYVNTARATYATVVGGSRNKAYSKFAAIPGGSKNTINGRYSFALGAKATITKDYAGAIGLTGAPCTPSSEGALAIC